MKLVTIYPYYVKSISVERPGRTRILLLELADGSKFEIRGSQVDRFLRLLNITYRNLMNIDELKREKVLLEKIRKRKHGIKLRIDNGRIVGVFSALFAPIPHGLIIKAVNDVLNEKGIETERGYEINHSFFGRWVVTEPLFKGVVDLEGVRASLWVYNKNDGQTAMRVGIGYFDYICQNGAMEWRNAERLRLVHKVPDDEIYNTVRNAVTRLLKRLDTVKEKINTAYEYSTDYKTGVRFIKKLRLPRYIEDPVRNMWAVRPRNLWYLSSAISHPAGFDSVPVSRKLFLMRTAFEVLNPEYFEEVISNGEREDNRDGLEGGV